MSSLRFHCSTFLAICAMACCLLTTAVTAQNFPDEQKDDKISTMGAFIIWVEPDYHDLVRGEPGWNHPRPNHWTSPAMIDHLTVIGRSKVHQDNDGTDSGGATVGVAGTVVKDSDFALVPAIGFTEGPDLTNEVHTEIYKLKLVDPSCRFTLRVGTDAGVAQASFGEVEDNNPGPADDFPAESFFNVFFEMDTPFGTLHNQPSDPLLIVNNAVDDLPPHVVYIHGETAAVPIYFKDGLDAGKRFGMLRLAGHGAHFSCERGEQKAPPTCPESYVPEQCNDDEKLLGAVTEAVFSGRMMDCADCSEVATGPISPPPEIPFWMIVLILILLVVILIVVIRKP